MNIIKNIQNKIKNMEDDNRKQWSSVIVRIRFETGISRIERPYEYLISKRLNPAGIYQQRGYFQCSGGSRKKNETFYKCAKREFIEECGWNNHTQIKHYDTMEYLDEEKEQRIVKIYTMDISSKDLIHIKNMEPEKQSPWIHKPLTEIMLLPVIGSLEYYVKKELQIQTIPKLILIEGIDGCGKTTLIENIMNKLGQQSCEFNTRTKFNKYDPFKFTRKDANYHNYNEGQFRQAVVQSINRRIEYVDGKKPYILADKSPYAEIFYQRTESFIEYQTRINPKQWKNVEKECMKHKDIIDNAYVFVIKRPRKQCFEKYFLRETQKVCNTSYLTLDQQKYDDMYKSFYNNISELYKDCHKIHYITNDFGY